MCNANNTIDCFDAQPLACASELHPEHVHVACQGCYGTAWGLKDTHRLIRYPTAFREGAPASTFQNYRTFEMLSLSVAVLILSPAPTLFSRMVASKNDTVGAAVPSRIGAHIHAVALNLTSLACGSWQAFKAAAVPMAFAAWLLCYVSVLYGVVWFGNHGPQFLSMGPPAEIVSTFGGLVADMIDVGGLAETVASIMMCGAVSSMLSTADSMVIATSTMFAVDGYQNLFWSKFRWGDKDGNVQFAGRNMSLGDQTIFFSKVISFVVIVIALVISLNREISITDLINAYVGLNATVGPAAYMAVTNIFGCGDRVSPPALVLGMLIPFCVYLYLNSKQRTFDACCLSLNALDNTDDCYLRSCVLNPDCDFNVPGMGSLPPAFATAVFADIPPDGVPCEEPPETLLTYDAFCALLVWVVTVPLCYIIPKSFIMTDDNPRYSNWDSPSKATLAKFGERMLSMDEVRLHTDKQMLPTNSWGWVMSLSGWLIAVLCMPWYDFLFTEEELEAGWCPGCEKVPPALSLDYVFGIPQWFFIQNMGGLIGTVVAVASYIIFWEADDSEASGLATLKQSITSMTAEDIFEWAATHDDPAVARHANTFKDQGVTGSLLVEMDSARLETMIEGAAAKAGMVVSAGELATISKSIEFLKTHGWMDMDVHVQFKNFKSLSTRKVRPIGIVWSEEEDPITKTARAVVRIKAHCHITPARPINNRPATASSIILCAVRQPA